MQMCMETIAYTILLVFAITAVGYGQKRPIEIGTVTKKMVTFQCLQSESGEVY